MTGTFRIGGRAPRTARRKNHLKARKTGLSRYPARFSRHDLENQLQSKLDQPFRRSDAAQHRGRNLTEPVIVRARGGTVEAGSRGRKIGMVEEVEELGAELETYSFGEWDPLEHS